MSSSKNIKLTYNEDMWYFEYSTSLYDIQNKISSIVENFSDSPASSEKKLLQIIKKHPFAFDAYYYLGHMYFWKKQIKNSQKILEQGYNVSLELFPKKFDLQKNQLDWGFIENRPFLRMYFQLGLVKMNHCLDESIKIFEQIISLNPNDNQGVRELLMKCYFEKDDMKSAIKLCKQYSDDSTPAISFGYVLALYKEKDLAEAKKACTDVIIYNSNVAKELIKKRHRFIDSDDQGFVEDGSAHEAYLYWEEFGKYWDNTYGATDVVAKCYQESLR